MNYRGIVWSVVALGLTGLAPLAGAEGLPNFTAQFNLKDIKAAAAEMPAVVSAQSFQLAAGAGDAARYPNVVLDSYTTYARLPNCSGTVELKIAGGNVNLIFRNVVNCSNFDITNSNGDFVDYANKKLGGGDRDRSGSFTIPRRFVDWGHNGIIVSLQSNSKKTRDLIRIHFWAF